jgi:hypothetical protein
MTTAMTFEEKALDLKATFAKILEAPGLYADDDDKGVCQRLVEALPEDLVEYAANTSYAYWYLASSPESCPSEEVKIAMAMKEARRHLAYLAGDYDKALANLTESAQYRKVRDNEKTVIRT